MSNEHTIPDLLPWDFAPEQVLTPERILQHQAELIGRKSGRRLNGELERTLSEDYLTLGFIVSAPLLNYSVRLFSCWHQQELPYPSTVEFPSAYTTQRVKDEEEFRTVVSNILASDYARSVFQSLIARIGEVTVKTNEIDNEDKVDSMPNSLKE